MFAIFYLKMIFDNVYNSNHLVIFIKFQGFSSFQKNMTSVPKKPSKSSCGTSWP